PPAAPTALQELLHQFFAQSFKGSHRLESAPLGHCPSLGPRPPCRDDRQRQAAAVSRPACGVQRWPAAGALARLGSGLRVAWGGRWRAACWEGPTGGLAWKGALYFLYSALGGCRGIPDAPLPIRIARAHDLTTRKARRGHW